MHAVFDWRIWLTLALLAFAAVTGIGIAVGRTPVGALQLAFSVTPTVALIFAISPLWRLIWLVPGVGGKLPLLDGRWVGVQYSNWPIIEALKDGAKSAGLGVNVDDAAAELPALLGTEVEATISCSFFAVKMHLDSRSKYQNSVVKVSHLLPSNEQHRPRFVYVFEGRVPKPKSTDVDKFDGAAELEVKREDSGEVVLAGPVWTNRNWTKGLNTAGCIELTRVEDGSVPLWLRRALAWCAKVLSSSKKGL